MPSLRRFLETPETPLELPVIVACREENCDAI